MSVSHFAKCETEESLFRDAIEGGADEKELMPALRLR